MKKSFKLLSSVLACLTIISTSSVTFAAPFSYKKVLKYGLIGGGITTVATLTAIGTYKILNEKIIEINSEEDFEQIQNCRDTITKAVVNVKIIPEYAFKNCTKLKEAELNEVNCIGNNAFINCKSLKNVKNSSSVETIEKYAFSDCSSLKGSDFSGVKNIQEGAFYGCKSLSKIDLSSIETIGAFSFSGCTSLQNVTLPKKSVNFENSILLQTYKTKTQIKFYYK